MYRIIPAYEKLNTQALFKKSYSPIQKNIQGLNLWSQQIRLPNWQYQHRTPKNWLKPSITKRNSPQYANQLMNTKSYQSAKSYTNSTQNRYFYCIKDNTKKPDQKVYSKIIEKQRNKMKKTMNNPEYNEKQREYIDNQTLSQHKKDSIMMKFYQQFQKMINKKIILDKPNAKEKYFHKRRANTNDKIFLQGLMISKDQGQREVKSLGKTKLKMQILNESRINRLSLKKRHYTSTTDSSNQNPNCSEDFQFKGKSKKQYFFEEMPQKGYFKSNNVMDMTTKSKQFGFSQWNNESKQFDFKQLQQEDGLNQYLIVNNLYRPK